MYVDWKGWAASKCAKSNTSKHIQKMRSHAKDTRKHTTNECYFSFSCSLRYFFYSDRPFFLMILLIPHCQELALTLLHCQRSAILRFQSKWLTVSSPLPCLGPLEIFPLLLGVPDSTTSAPQRGFFCFFFCFSVCKTDNNVWRLEGEEPAYTEEHTRWAHMGRIHK